MSVRLPWHAFVPVKRARVDPAAPPLDPSKVQQLGLVSFPGCPGIFNALRLRSPSRSTILVAASKTLMMPWLALP